MAFCSNCGNEVLPGAAFCGSCGAQQITPMASCTRCSKSLEVHEKFCSACGTPVKNVTTKPPPSNTKEPKYTKEGSKIISGGSVKNQNYKDPLVPPQQKKKKRGCLGCFFTSLIIVTLFVVVGIIAVNFTTDWFDQIKEEWNKTTKLENTETLSSPDYEAPETIENDAIPFETIEVKESKDIKVIANTMEEVFLKADTSALKSLLNETSAEKYKTVYTEIHPYMHEYAKAFKNRKLVHSNAFYTLYSFRDDEGNQYTVEFASTGDGNWKLVRF